MNQVIMANSTMAKKMKTAQKSGKKFHCRQCDALCDGKRSFSVYSEQDLYMGRVDDSKKNDWFFCSNSCERFYIRNGTLESLKDVYEQMSVAEAYSADRLRLLIKLPTRNLEREINATSIWKSSRVQLQFYKACLDKRPLQELLLLQSKTLKQLGDTLETFHEDSEFMDLILAKVKFVEQVPLDYL